MKPRSEPPPLAPNDVHVWSLALDAAPPRLDALRRALSPDEVERAERFRFARDRDRFVAARGQLREVLALYLAVAPPAVSFAYGPQGKPMLQQRGGLRFNLSHAEDEAILAVAKGREVGIDIERIRPEVECEDIAQRFFSPAEVAALLALPATARPPVFFTCWTRKEAFIKALGGGLGIPLTDFEVSLEPAGPARLLRTAWDPAVAGRWRLHTLAAPPGFAAALAVEGGEPRIRTLRLP